MAPDRDEHKMVFDIRGRRKNVVKVVYGILALLMAASLLLVVGPAPLSELFGIEDAANSAADQFEEQVETVERKLKKDPQNPDLLLALTRARINTGNSLATTNSETEAVEFTPEARQKLEEGSESWAKYVKASEEPNAGAAQLMAQTEFTLAQTSAKIAEIKANIAAAADAQEIVAKDRPSLGSLSTLAIYRYYAFDFKGAEAARKEAAKFATTKFERENLTNELDSIEKRAHEFQKEVVQIEKAEAKARAKGEAGTTNPLKEGNPFVGP
jgi:hypothetical protein